MCEGLELNFMIKTTDRGDVMLLRLCGFGGRGDPYEIVCGDWKDIWPDTTNNKKYEKLANSRDFGNRYQGQGTHWIEDVNGNTLD